MLHPNRDPLSWLWGHRCRRWPVYIGLPLAILGFWPLIIFDAVILLVAVIRNWRLPEKGKR